MNIYLRIIISIAILIIHFVGFFLPLTEVFVIYILLVNPAWFRNLLNNLDKPKESSHQT
jgi:hypothetical protein